MTIPPSSINRFDESVDQQTSSHDELRVVLHHCPPIFSSDSTPSTCSPSHAARPPTPASSSNSHSCAASKPYRYLSCFFLSGIPWFLFLKKRGSDRNALFGALILNFIDLIVSGVFFLGVRGRTGEGLFFLRGFWARGRVRGDRSVFFASHRPVHSSRALLFQPGSSFCISVQERYFLFAHLPPRCTSMSLTWSLPRYLTLIIKVLLLEFEQVFLCELHTPPPLFSGFRGQRSPPQRPVLRRSRNEPCSVTLVSQELLGQDPFGICHNSQNRRA